MPTGIFNEMLYDFVCCEDASCMSLQCEDLAVKPQRLYCGLTSAWLHRDHFRTSPSTTTTTPFRLVCKESQSLHDLFTVTGATVMTNKSLAPTVPTQRSAWLQRLFVSMINTDYCAIRCRRCDAWLGDARIDLTALDDEAAAEAAEAEGDAAIDVRHYEFPLSTVQHLQFAWHTIDVSVVRNGTMMAPLHLSILQLAGRLSLYVMEKFAKPLLCFYVASTFGPATATAGAKATADRPVIIIKVLSKQSTVARATGRSGSVHQAESRAVVKATYRLGQASAILRGSEVRIPLEMPDFQELQQSIQQLSTQWKTYHETMGSMRLLNEEICFLPL